MEEKTLDEFLALAKTAAEMEAAGVDLSHKFVMQRIAAIYGEYNRYLRSRERIRNRLFNTMALLLLFAVGNLSSRFGLDSEIVMKILPVTPKHQGKIIIGKGES